MSDDADPLQSRMSEYIANGNHDSTPDKVLREADLDESCRVQVEQYLAITRYTLFKDNEGELTPTFSDGTRLSGPR